MGNYRIRVRIGLDEFEAEGPEQLVKQQYEQFLASLPASSGVPKPRLTRAQVERYFVVKNDLVRPKPPVYQHGESRVADFVLLVLYAWLALRDAADVPSSELLATLKQAMYVNDPDRVDRLLFSRSGFYKKVGVRRGTRYSLTRDGVEHVEALIRNAMSPEEKGG